MCIRVGLPICDPHDWSRLRCDNRDVTETNLVLARRGYEAALRGDLDAIGELLDTDVKWHGGDLSATGAWHNREQALEFMRQARNRRRVGELIDGTEFAW